MSDRPTSHLSLADVEALHRHVMARMDSSPAPFRAGGEALLESAVMRPRVAAHYEEADLIRQAALLGVGISQSQAFLDGNKRTAFAALRAFLGVNGFTFAVDSLRVAEQLVVVAERDDSLEAATGRFETWLRDHIARLDG